MVVLTIKEFPLFVKIPGKKGRLLKINSNKLYSNSIPFYRRVLIKTELSLFVKSFLKRRRTPYEVKSISFKLYAPESLGAINSTQIYKEDDKLDKLGYRRWDLTNFSYFWQKIIEDVLVEYNYIVDDDVKNIRKISWEFYPSTFKERKIEVILL